MKQDEKGRFVKGGIPWNKGKKMSDEIRAKCEPTMFKKGNRPKNILPIGSEVKKKNGYVYIKVADVLRDGYKNWKPKQVVVYENHYNVKVNARTHNVVFLDGDKYNFDINNLMLVSKRVNRIVNTHYAKSEDAEINKLNILQANLSVSILDTAEKLGQAVVYTNKNSKYKSRRIKKSIDKISK
jgi:hypothetical protein